ncbi:MAG TPA: polymer-forming cytoskeletal protein [Thermoanaerobaculia bacterium]|nr:polymer-forming cytoskeletal protein [Thermoanaerobaculia bacterium]
MCRSGHVPGSSTLPQRKNGAIGAPEAGPGCSARSGAILPFFLWRSPLAFFGKNDNAPPPPAPSTPLPPSPAPNVPRERSPGPPASAAPVTGASAATTIGARMRVVGDVIGDEDLVVNGRIEGKIRVDRKVVVSPGAEVEGDLQAKSVVVGGSVRGQVTASERAELLPSGRVQGNVHAPRIVMAEGAQIQGRVVMPSDAATRPLSSSRPEESKRPPAPAVPPKTDDPTRRPASPPVTGG